MKKIIVFTLMFASSNIVKAQELIQPTRKLPASAFSATREPQDLTIISSGIASFEKRMQMIASAKHSIDADYFIYNKDHAGRIFTNALIQKAHQGVRVRLLVDASLYTLALTNYDAYVLRKEGIEVRFYNNVSPIHAAKVQYRSHRKCLVIDEEQSITGGRNIADEYFEMSSEYNFLDRDVYMRGSLAKSIALSFEAFWNNSFTTVPYPVKKPLVTDYGFSSEADAHERQFTSANDREVYHNYQTALFNYNKGMREAQSFLVLTDEDKQILAHVHDKGPQILEQSPHSICNETYFLADKPGFQHKDRVLFDQFINLTHHSHSSIFLETPYFVLTSGDHILESLIKRGFKVQVLTNSLYSTDSLMTIADFYPRANKLTNIGGDIYIYKGRAPTWYPDLSNPLSSQARWGTHAKSAVLDDDTSVVASFNIDPRSENINSEMALICRGNKTLAKGLLKDMNFRKSQAVLLDKSGNPSDGESLYFGDSLTKLLLYHVEMPPSQLLDFLM